MTGEAVNHEEGIKTLGLPPKVSWVLCCNRYDRQLELAIESCLNQDFDDYEVVIVMNGPESEDLARRVNIRFSADERIRVFHTPIKHLTFSLNFGIHCARGIYIARLDADDVAYPHRLKLQVNFLDLHPEIGVLGTAYELIDRDGNSRGRPGLLFENDSAIRKALTRGNALCHPTVMMRKSIAVRMGGYMGGEFAQDYDLWVRIAMSTEMRFATLPVVCVGYRATSIGMARRARASYAVVAAAQLRQFLERGGLRWAVGCLMSVAKALIVGRTSGSQAADQRHD